MTDKDKRQAGGSIHSAAAVGFQASPAVYDRGRPSYPAEAVSILVSMLGITSAAVVVDLGAGTGKFSSIIANMCERVVAIEPVEAMRRIFAQLNHGIVIVAGYAESIPLTDGSVDAVVCAQAFHWFDAPRAIGEIHRVLRPHGRLGLIWNVRDESVPWMAKLTEIIDVHAGGTPRYRDGNWRGALNQTKLFSPLQETRFPHVQRGNMEMVLDRVASISFIAALPESERSDVLKKTRELLLSEVISNARGEVEFQYVAHALWCEKREG